MDLTAAEAQFLTALAREQNQTGCRGPAQDLLRKHVYPDAPLVGPDSLAFSYEAVPLTTLLVQDLADLQAIDDFLRKGEKNPEPVWPWSSPQQYSSRLEEARRVWAEHRRASGSPFNGADNRQAKQPPPVKSTGG
jgi:hypothetical protein